MVLSGTVDPLSDLGRQNHLSGGMAVVSATGRTIRQARCDAWLRLGHVDAFSDGTSIADESSRFRLWQLLLAAPLDCPGPRVRAIAGPQQRISHIRAFVRLPRYIRFHAASPDRAGGAWGGPR